MIREENILRPGMSSTVKEHAPNVSDDKNANNESKNTNADKWVKPKKCMLINCFHEKYENKSEWKKNINACVSLGDNDEIKEKEEKNVKVNNNELKMMKAKVVKNNKKLVNTINKQKYESKLSERLENYGVDHEEELRKSKKLEIELKNINIFLVQNIII